MSLSAADATALSQAQLASDVSVAVAKKVQDHQKQQGQAALDLLSTAAAIARQPVQPGKGLGVDVTV